MDKKIPVILTIGIASKHSQKVCEKYDTTINLNPKSLDSSIRDLKKPLSESVKKNLIHRIAENKERNYIVIIRCQIGEKSGEVKDKFELEKFEGEKFYMVLKRMFDFSDNLSDSLSDKVRCVVLKTTDFRNLCI